MPSYQRPSSEALLISALVNTQDVEAAHLHGITPEMFYGYQAEYRWVLSYFATYHCAPSKEALLHKFDDFPLTDHDEIGYAADEVRQSHTKRMLTKAIRDASEYIVQGDLDEAVLAISSFAPAQQVLPMRNLLTDTTFLRDYDLRVDAMKVPWHTLQKTTGGMRPGDLWYLAARLGQGKSWSLGCFVRDALLAGRNVLFYSLEMSQAQVMTRMHTLLGSQLGLAVDHQAMRDKSFDFKAYQRIHDAIKEQVKGQLFVQDASNGRTSPTSIVANGKGMDLVVVDYVGLMALPTGSRAVDDWRNMASISNMLKEVAVSADLRILAAAQINREGDAPGWKPPKVKNLSQSDALGQDADVVVTHKQFSRSSMVYGIEKNRHGEAGVHYFSKFEPNHGKFHEITREQAEELRANEVDE